MLKKLFLILTVLSIIFSAFSQEIIILSDEDIKTIGEYEELAEYYQSVDNIQQAIFYLNRIAFIYWENGSLNEAINYFLQSVPLYEKKGNLEDLKIIYSNIALIYTDLEQLDKALEFFMKSLEIRRKIGDQKEISSGLIDVAYIANIVGDYEGSNELLEEALGISLELEYPSLTLSCYNLMSENYNQIGNVKKAEEFREKYDDFQKYTERENIKEEFVQREDENLIEIERTRAEKRAKEAELQLRQLQFQLSQDSMAIIVQAKADSLQEAERIDSLRRQEIEILEQREQLQEAKLAEQQAQQRIARLIIYSISIGLVLVVAIAFFAYRGFKVQQKLNIELESKNIEIETKSKQLESAYQQIEAQNINITKSINYAKGIQRALLPQQELLNTFIPESFVLFKPREVVSGDFYWFSEIDKRVDLYETKREYLLQQTNDSFEDFKFLPIENNKFAISAIDCTGHGVPGAFMSMIGYNLLDEIISNGISRADIILNELHKGVRKTLKQDITDNRDGMDMALCVINKIERTVNFAGAENPLLYIQNGEVSQIKGDRNPIGGLQTEKTRVFTGHTVKVDRPTWFYILSDGFVDQFGGPKGRKFLISNLRNLLLDIHKKPMKEQKAILNRTFEEWLTDEQKQIDDVLLIGFKLG